MDPALLLVLPTALVILFGIQAVPLLVLAINSGKLQLSFDSPAATAELIQKSVLLRQWLQPLQSLGFVVLGVKSEKLPLWAPAYRELALVSQNSDAYASIVLHADSTPASLYFYTPLRDGGMVFTRNFAGREAEGERLSVRNIESMNFQTIFDDHLGRVQSFRTRGLLPAVSATQAARLAATTAFYNSEYGRQSLPPLWSPPIRRFAAALVFLLAAVIWTVARAAPGS